MGYFCLRIKNNKSKKDGKKTTKNNSNGKTTTKNNNNEKATQTNNNEKTTTTNNNNGDSSKNGFIETSKKAFNIGKDIGSPLLTLYGVAGNQPEVWV